METRATPSVARRLVGVLPETANRGRQQSQTIAVLLVVLSLGFQPLCTAAAIVCPTGCNCQPSGEQVSCVGLTSIPRFFGHNPKVLRIAQHRISKITSRSFRGLEHLEELEITGGRLSEISDDAFSSLRHVKNVNLSHNELTVLPRDSFATCLQLQQLDLSWNPLVLPRRSAMLASKTLSALDMSFCGLSRLPDEVFSMVPALSELRMRGNNLLLVSECILDPVKELILLDAEPTIQWARCSSQESTTSGIQQMTGQGDSESGHVSPTDNFLAYAQVMLIPTLAQWIFLTVAALFLVLLLTRIRKACQPDERRKEHTYEILGGSQTAHLPVNLYHDFRTSRISSNSCETFADSTRISMSDGESRQYLPNYLHPGSALKP